MSPDTEGDAEGCYRKLVSRVMDGEKEEGGVCVQHALHCIEMFLASGVRQVLV